MVPIHKHVTYKRVVFVLIGSYLAGSKASSVVDVLLRFLEKSRFITKKACHLLVRHRNSLFYELNTIVLYSNQQSHVHNVYVTRTTWRAFMLYRNSGYLNCDCKKKIDFQKESKIL